MIPENAGGRAHATTSILRFIGSILNTRPSTSTNAGIMISLRIHPSTACQLMLTFTAESVTPAANTAIEALAPLIRSNDGLAQSGQGIPAITHTTARIGAHATGCSNACITGFQALGRFCPAGSGFSFSFAELSNESPTGIPIALTTIPTIATTRATDGCVPKIGSSTAKPRNPIVGEPHTNAIIAPSALVFFLKQ